MKTKTYFQFRVDIWDDDGNNVVDHIAYFELAEATYRAAVVCWPAARIMLRHGARCARHRATAVKPAAEFRSASEGIAEESKGYLLAFEANGFT